MSIRQGDRIGLLIRDFSRPWNRIFDGKPIVVPDDGPLPRVPLAGGVTITLLSPLTEQLGRLQTLWQRDLMKARVSPDALELVGPSTLADEEEAVPATGETERVRGQRAFDAVRADADLESLANVPFHDDMSIPNGSSIALLIEAGEHSLLIGADAYSRVLETSIRRLLDERGQDRLRLSVFVVPRGGSRTSVSRELLELINCNRYVIASSGRRYNHPNSESIARILVYGRAEPDAQQTLIFNYRSKFNEVWANRLLQQRYRYQAIYPVGDQAGLHFTAESGSA